MELIVAVLATYIITLMLVETSGPFDIFFKLRRLNWMEQYGLLLCTICTSVNVSLITALYVSNSVSEYVISVFAIAGGAVIIDKLMERFA